MFEDLENKKTEYKSLEELPDIGPATVNKLKEIGFRTIESLSTATIAELVSAGIGEAIADKTNDEDIINQAKLLIELGFKKTDYFCQDCFWK